jgi:hypothetical protein
MGDFGLADPLGDFDASLDDAAAVGLGHLADIGPVDPASLIGPPDDFTGLAPAPTETPPAVQTVDFNPMAPVDIMGNVVGPAPMLDAPAPPATPEEPSLLGTIAGAAVLGATRSAPAAGIAAAVDGPVPIGDAIALGIAAYGIASAINEALQSRNTPAPAPNFGPAPAMPAPVAPEALAPIAPEALPSIPAPEALPSMPAPEALPAVPEPEALAPAAPVPDLAPAPFTAAPVGPLVESFPATPPAMPQLEGFPAAPPISLPTETFPIAPELPALPGFPGEVLPDTGLIATFPPEIEQALTLERSSPLRGRMIAAGVPIGADDDAHHVAALNEPAAQPARDVLAGFGIDINDPVNGVALPRGFHQRELHGPDRRAAYYAEVNSRLAEAETREQAEAILRGIADELRNEGTGGSGQ